MTLAHRRQRDRRRLSAIADAIGARHGRVILDRFHGGVLMPSTLNVTSLRPGPPDDVGLAQVHAAVFAGYPAPGPRYGSQLLWVLGPTGRFPQLRIEVFGPDTIIRGIWSRVPDGQSAVVITL